MSSTTAATPGRSEWDGGGVSPLGASYGKLMMWFFLLSDAFTFSALLITYGFVRSDVSRGSGLTSYMVYLMGTADISMPASHPTRMVLRTSQRFSSLSPVFTASTYSAGSVSTF